MEQNERDPIKTAVEGMLGTDILLEFVEEMELPPVDILAGVRRAGNKVISNQDEELQNKDFRLLVAAQCAEISAILLSGRVEPEEMKSIIQKSLRKSLAEYTEAETDTYQ